VRQVPRDSDPDPCVSSPPDLDAVKLLSIVAARLEDGAAAANTLRLDAPGFVLR